MGFLTSHGRVRRQFSRRFLATSISLILVTYTIGSLVLQRSAIFPASSLTGIFAHTGSEQLTPSSSRSDLDDYVLVIKTGATESLRKLPVHFETTVRRWPHVLFLSDFEEQLKSYQIHDALEVVHDSIKLNHPTFDLWRRLHDRGRSALISSEPEKEDRLQWVNTTSDMESDRRQGWVLAKFMNIPMAVKALELKPEAKWYAFIDADTFISWSNLVRLTHDLDHTKPVFIGSQLGMAPGEFFAHGGSGYIISQDAMAKVVQHYRTDRYRYDSYASFGEVGEVPLARALLDIGIPLTWGFPHFQGGDASVMDFGHFESGRRIWCYPAVTYHHTSASVIRGLSQFEEAWLQSSNAHRPFRHSNVFRDWVFPQISAGERIDWDNSSDDPVEGINDAKSCHEACERNNTCIQYTFHADQCKTGGSPKAGYSRAGAKAGWNLERVKRFTETLDDKCRDLLLA